MTFFIIIILFNKKKRKKIYQNNKIKESELKETNIGRYIIHIIELSMVNYYYYVVRRCVGLIGKDYAICIKIKEQKKLVQSSQQSSEENEKKKNEEE